MGQGGTDESRSVSFQISQKPMDVWTGLCIGFFVKGDGLLIGQIFRRRLLTNIFYKAIKFIVALYTRCNRSFQMRFFVFSYALHQDFRV